jgi:hypothetical protein
MKFQRFYLLCVAVIVFFWILDCGPATSSIETVDSFTQINWEAISQDSLVVFDVDGVLIMPVDAIFQPTKHNRALEKKLREASEHSEQSEDDFWRKEFLFSIQQKSQLVEPIVVQILNNLQHRKIKTIALTYSSTGSYASFPSLESMRVDTLKSLGIDFSKSFSNLSLLRMKRPDLGLDRRNFSVLKGGKYPIFKEGILFANRNPKGAVLSAFLDYLSWTPRDILFIDDRLSFLRDVQAMCYERNIPFKGVLYRGTDKCVTEADEDVASLQFSYFEKHLIWLGDEEAKQKLSAHKDLQK